MGVIKKYKPHVFIVMPFGRREVRPATGQTPAVEVDFDQVWQLLLAPALEQAGCEPFRADEEPGPGDIRTDMFFELATADVVLADISILNPNVFYELGVRQGVAERGVIMVHGGHSKRPFDIASDRTFSYDGNLFIHPVAAASPQLELAVKKLAQQIAAALAADPAGQSSPVYKELSGLRPPDVREIKSAKARYFDAAFEEIAKRVAVARKKGLVGDILTLAEEAPNRLYRARLLGIAGKSLLDLQHFELALDLLRETVALNPSDIDAESFIGLALNRIGRSEEAEVWIQDLVGRVADHNDGQGALGRVYKDQWRSRFDRLGTQAERKEAAATYAAIAEKSIASYAAALERDQRSYYNGINALGLAALVEHVGETTAFAPAKAAATELVRIVAEQAVQATKNAKDDDGTANHIWALATCGELALLRDDAALAGKHFTKASTTPGVTLFQLESMLRQIELYELLGFAAGAAQAARQGIEKGRALLPKASSAPRHVLFASGHMIDLPARPKPRFPPGQEAAVAARIEQCLSGWQLGPDDLAICGAARGADLLVAEACLKRGCAVALHVAREEGDYLVESVDLPTGKWRERYFAVKGNPLTRTRFQPDELGMTPQSMSVHTRNNRWCLNSAWATAQTRERVFVLLVWDNQPTGDGPGGTSHAAELAKQFAGKLADHRPHGAVSIRLGQ